MSRADLLALNGVPAQADLEQMLVALAQFHAAFWEPPDFGSGPEQFAVRPWYRDEAHFARHVERRQREWAAFVATDHDWPPPAIRAVYAQALADLPHLWQRGLGEWLCLRAAGAASVYLVDFDAVSANYAAYDLVYMLATFWTWKQRRDAGHELAALKLYHDALEAAGVKEYCWEQPCADYALMPTADDLRSGA